MLLGSAFGRAGDAAIVLVNFPLGLIGGVAGALLLPEGLSVAGFVGFVTLFGIIARNGIMLVSHIRHLEHEAPDEPPVARVLRAAEERLLPIAMTAATAGLGLLPLAISLGSAGSELEAPMAVIVCGGLVTSTLLNMIELRDEIATAHARLSAALSAMDAAADIPPILDREVQLLDKALRAGGIELAAWAQQAHRLVEVGRSYDAAVLALQRARAAWARVAPR